MNLKDALKKYQELLNEQKGILAKDSLTAEELSRAEDISPELDTLDTEIKRLEGLDAIRVKNAERQAHLDTVERPQFLNGDGTGTTPKADPAASLVLPAHAKRHRVTSFKGADAQLKAYRLGMFFLAAIKKNSKAQDYCKKNGIALVREEKGAMEGDDAAGGFLVPEEFENDLIDLREEYGVIRKLAKTSTMHSDTKVVPRRRDGLIAYAVGEGQEIPESKKAWNRVGLTAKKFAVLTLYTNEVSEDAIIDIGDDLAKEIAYAFSQKEDDCGFNGDGTSPFNKIVGFRPKFKLLSATRANIAGLQVASANNWGGIKLGDLTGVKGKLPKYARTKDTRWVTNQAFFNDVMETLMIESGGVTAAEVASGRLEDSFLGYPVEITQVMPDQSAPDDIPVLFGDFGLASLFGDRRQTTIAMSSEYAFDTDEMAIRGTERFDINVHDIGNASATASQRKAGPVVGLITAA